MIELPKREEERAIRLHKEAIVIDTHCDTLLQLVDTGNVIERFMGVQPPRKLGERSEVGPGRGHVDLPKLIEGGIDCQTFALFGGHTAQNLEALRIVMLKLDAFYNSIDENKDKIVQVRNHDEIIEAHKTGKIGALLSMESSEALMGEIGILRVFSKLGLRMLSFCWNWRTRFADGLFARRAESKLPEMGIKALEEMNRLGILLDVSHLSDSCFWDVVENIKDPFIASHSCCRALCDHPRNLTDDMLRAVAEKGGVIGINYASGFILPKEKLGTGQRATIKNLVDHIDHVVKVVGPEYVGLGSDFDGITYGPAGLEDVSKVPNITKVLVKRGYSDEDIIKILGGNHLRVFKQVLR